MSMQTGVYTPIYQIFNLCFMYEYASKHTCTHTVIEKIENTHFCTETHFDHNHLQLRHQKIATAKEITPYRKII